MRMTIEELREYVKSEAHVTLNKEEIEHVAHGLENIQQWYYNDQNILGHFLTSVVKNDFIKAVCNADSTNIKALVVYAKFLYNRLPFDYMIKVKKL